MRGLRLGRLGFLASRGFKTTTKTPGAPLMLVPREDLLKGWKEAWEGLATPHMRIHSLEFAKLKLAADLEKEDRKQDKVEEELKWPIACSGKRKTAIAVVLLSKDTGEMKKDFRINKRCMYEYLASPAHIQNALSALGILNMFTNNPAEIENKAIRDLVKGGFKFNIKVSGGGISGQSDAIKLGIAKCLVKLGGDEVRAAVRAQRLLTRDPRVVESKKPGRKKARKKFQWVKR